MSEVDKFFSLVKRISEYVSDLFEAEKEGRDIAYRGEEFSTTSEAGSWLKLVSDRTYMLMSSIDEVLKSRVGRESLPPEIITKLEKIRDILDRVFTVATRCSFLARRCLTEGFYEAKSCELVLPVDVKRSIEEIDELCKGVFGSKCTWLYGVKEPYTLSSLVNDLSAVVHRVAEWLFNNVHIEKMRSIDTRIKYIRDTARELLDFLKTWDRAIEQSYRDGLYNPSDYNFLSAYAQKDRAYIVVGSSPGHRTVVYSTGVVEYHDTDKDVVDVVDKLLTDYSDCRCEVVKTDGYVVKCTCPVDKLRNVAKVLALATSMDFRIDNPEGYWKKELVEKCRGFTVEGLSKPASEEYCRALIYLREVLRDV